MKAQPSSIQRAVGFTLLLIPFLSLSIAARKFYRDDPLEQEPPPLRADKVASRRISDAYDLFSNTLSKRGERTAAKKPIPAGAVNTLGEVPDNTWYTNRHYKKPLSIEELVRGPGDGNPPDTSGPLMVVSAKTEGVTPGFVMEDARGRRYNVKFDPLTNPEMATSADVIVSKFFYALGYNVPENYTFTFARSQLRIAPTANVKTKVGKRRPMTERDLTELFLKAPKLPDGRYRAVASLYLTGKSVGEFRYYGTRSDDPNDIVPHEHRRDLRGLRVFCAWLGHDDSRAINTLDMLVEDKGVQFIRHYLIDFGATLGSDSYRPNSPASGNVYWFAWDSVAAQFFSLGLDVPRWMRAHYPKIPAVGRFEADAFDPEKWVPFYPCAAFDNCLPDDAFWAAKQVMAFSDEQIRALVKTGHYTNPQAEQWIAECLIKRRDKIGKAYFAKVLPLDRFEVRDGRLAFEDLAVKHKLASPRDYTVQWSRFNNDTEQKTPLGGATGLSLPRAIQEAVEGEYFAADMSAGDKQKTLTVYLRKKAGQMQVVGVDRTW
jgi:hypothetical protein